MTRVKKPKRTGSILLSRHRNAGTKDSVLPVPHAHPVTTSALSSKTGRTVIRKHHTLHKRLSQALKKNDVDTAAAIQAEIEANGGLEKYQQASVSSRSHDTQRWWLKKKMLLRTRHCRFVVSRASEEVIHRKFLSSGSGKLGDHQS